LGSIFDTSSLRDLHNLCFCVICVSAQSVQSATSVDYFGVHSVATSNRVGGAPIIAEAFSNVSLRLVIALRFK